jgi:hypothetical protein
MSRNNLMLLSTIAAVVYGIFYFRGDLRRYAKMKMM